MNRRMFQSTPHDTEIDMSRIEILDKHLDSLIEEKKLVGAAYAVSHKGKTFASGYSGFLQNGQSVPMPENPVVRAASVTKMFTTVAIMKLVDDGKIILTQPVSDFIEEFKQPPHQDVTILQLLTHSSGFFLDWGIDYNHPNKASASELVMTAYDKGDTNWIKAVLRAPRKAEANKEYAYASVGFSILGEIISRMTQTPAHEYIEENICKPLGMFETKFNLTPEMCDRLILTDNIEDWKTRFKEIKSNTPPKPSYRDNVPQTASGLFSTLDDLIKFGNMIAYYGSFAGARIISRKSAEKMSENHTKLPSYCWGQNGVIRPMALGFEYFEGGNQIYSNGTLFHEGSGAMEIVIDPHEKLVDVLFVPFAGGWVSKALMNSHNIIWSSLV